MPTPPDLLFIIHDPDTSTGSTGDWCRERSLSFETIVASDWVSKPDLTPNVGGLIIFGGDMQVWEIEKNPWLELEKKLIKDAIVRDQRVFGICLGAQLLAEQLGARITPMPGWEIGWRDVDGETSDPKDMAVACLRPLHWHCSELSLPYGAVRLASNKACENQGFRVGTKHVGFQFHTEIDQPRLDYALEKWSSKHRGFVQSKERIRSEAIEAMPVLRKWYFSQLDAWWGKD